MGLGKKGEVNFFSTSFRFPRSTHRGNISMPVWHRRDFILKLA
jgi:hypothetical protein